MFAKLVGVLPNSFIWNNYENDYPLPEKLYCRCLTCSDLARNYLSGTIPPEWASTKVEYM